jgi:hypothetical protein
LADIKVTVLDLSPSGFNLFKFVKSQLKGRHFSRAGKVKDAMTTILKSIPEMILSGASTNCTADGKVYSCPRTIL